MKGVGRMKTIGRIGSRLAGLEYSLGRVRTGDKLSLEREPGNPHDSNAIRVSCGESKIGYIERKDAAWIAPLLDAGLIGIKATPTVSGEHTGTPVELTVKTTCKGDTVIFSPNRDDSPQAVLHNSLLAVYLNIKSYSAETLKSVTQRLPYMSQGSGMLPETALIYRIILATIQKMENRPAPCMGGRLREIFKEMNTGSAILCEGISIVPLFGKKDSGCAYMNCGEALDGNTLSIQELNESGVVSTLTATNKGDMPVFIIGGQGLKGAKQDRIVNVSIIIDIKMSVSVPVSCVEARRWNYSGDKAFRKTNLASPSIRYCLSETVNKNVKASKAYNSNQGKIWETVDKVAEDANVKSETACLNDVYDSYDKRLKDFSEKVRYPDKACGIAVFKGPKLVSVDFFQHPELMKANWDDIVRSVALGTVDAFRKQTKTPPVFDEGKSTSGIKKFLDGIAEAAAAPEKSPGRGRYIRSQSDKHEAGILIDDDELVHLSAYKIKKG